ncbi:MAG TPA: 4-alpha-glucanotransferase, partial [Azospirillaceae bacterium]|nr:4-alpha-glucanotransferase [Azospirillaceae bacterium]
LATGAAVGAPPDLLNLMGQNWGLTPLSPLGLRERAYAPFIAALRANMRAAGALRIDHVMGLMHMFWLPDRDENGVCAPGAYVAYPFEDLLRIVALESHRNRCLVIGEDLGTVPDDFRPRMAEAGVLSYRVLYFERDRASGDFLPADAYPAEALATVTTHDLPPLRGFWTGRDLEWRRLLSLYPSDEMMNADAWERGVDRWRLLRALEQAGLRPSCYPDNEGGQAWTADLTAAVHQFLARSPAALLTAALEDAVEELEQPNLPGTVDQHPNWRRRLPINLKGLSAHPAVRRLAAACNARKTSTTG